MLYQEARKYIRTGDLFACHGTELFSRIIERETKSYFSHVGLAVWMRYGNTQTNPRLCIFEAQNAGIGVRLHPITAAIAEYKKTHEQVWWCALKADSGLRGDNIVGHSLDLWGFEYPSNLEMLSIKLPFLRRFLRIIGHPAGKSTFHCSKTVSYGLEKCGWKFNRDLFLVTPREVVELPIWDEPKELGF